jgi:hypothetical protein
VPAPVSSACAGPAIPAPHDANRHKPFQASLITAGLRRVKVVYSEHVEFFMEI